MGKWEELGDAEVLLFANRDPSPCAPLPCNPSIRDRDRSFFDPFTLDDDLEGEARGFRRRRLELGEAGEESR